MADDDISDDDLDDDPFDEDTRTPVHVVGRVIARGPVGAAWCAFVDGCGSPGRAERGQAYVRAGALLDLRVRPGCITAVVDAAIRLRPIVTVPLPDAVHLAALRIQVSEAASSRELPIGALVPEPGDLLGSCGCNDRVPLCEHVLAALYGFAARLDAEPELLLVLRGLDATAPAAPTSLVIAPLRPDRVALAGSLAALFNLNLRDDPLPADAPLPQPPPLEDSPVASHHDAAASEPAPPGAHDDVSAHAGPGSPSPGSSAAPTGKACDEVEASDEVEPADESTPDAAPPEPATPLAEVRRDYLKFIGIRSRTIDIWIREGVLVPTDRFHVYLRTPEANHRIAQKLAR